MKYYYINLKNAVERRKNMEKFFENLSEYLDEEINFTRIEGLDANKENNIDDYVFNGNFSNMLSNYCISNIINKYGILLKPNNRPVFTKSLKKGEFGCLYSHLLALNDFLNSDENIAMICEDDLQHKIFYKKDYFKEKFNEIKNKLSNYGIISLSIVGHYKYISKMLDEKKELFSFTPYIFYGTGCYIINKDTARLILKNSIIFSNDIMKIIYKQNTSFVADNYLYSFSNTQFFIPSLFFTNETYGSSIDNNTTKHKIVQDLMINSIEKSLLNSYLVNTYLTDSKKKIENKKKEITNNKENKKKLTNIELLRRINIKKF
jgi:GR25 family glycosyltransferase involved in LPS biosynthesis